MTRAKHFRWTDGGRASEGLGEDPTGDCVVRAISIATRLNYVTVRAMILDQARRLRMRCEPDRGVHRTIYAALLERLGWTRVRPGDKRVASAKRLILNTTRHLVAVVDGVVYDTWDPMTKDDPRARRIENVWVR